MVLPEPSNRSTALERGEHGTLACHTSSGCRCRLCVAARRRYDRTRWSVLQALRGASPQWKTSTARAREHVGVLRAAGWSVAEIAEGAQIGSATLWRLLREP